MKSSFSDKFLIEAGTYYVYDISNFFIYKYPILEVQRLMDKAYFGKYKIVYAKNLDDDITLRYMVVADISVFPIQYALIFQGSDLQFETALSGSDTDWSNNFNNAVHLPVDNMEIVKKIYNNLKNTYNITAASGNSLGGGYTLALSDYNKNIDAIAINPSPTPYNQQFDLSVNAKIVITSTDMLSRLLKLDISRYKKSDYKKLKQLSKDNDMQQFEVEIDKLNYPIKHFYNHKIYYVKRFLSYFNKTYLFSAHRGSHLNVRDNIIDIYKSNVLYYSSSVAGLSFSEIKDMIKYSHYFLKLSTNSIDGQEYKILVDKLIYPNFIEIHKKKIQNYHQLTNLADFMQYDLDSKKLINSDGSTLFENNYVISDKYNFLINLDKSKKVLKKNLDYSLNSIKIDLEADKYFDTKTNLKRDTSFFITSLDNNIVSLNLDVLEIFKGWSITTLYKTFTLMDYNYRLLKKFKDDVFAYLKTNDELYASVREDYHPLFNEILENLNYNIKLIYKNIDILYDNVKKALNNEFNLQSLNKIDLNLSLTLEENYLLKQFNDILAIVDNHRKNSQEAYLNVVESSETVVNTAINHLKNKKVLDDNEEKVLEQLLSMNKNIDFLSMYYLFFKVFRKDIVAFIFANTVSFSIITHFTLLKESLEQYLNLLNNLQLYIKTNINLLIRGKIKKDIKIIQDDISKIIDYLNSFIEN